MKQEGGFVFERDYHVQPGICVCCRWQHSSSLYVLCAWACDVYEQCVCFFQPLSKSSAYRVLLCVSCQAAGWMVVWPAGWWPYIMCVGLRWPTCCPCLGLHHSLPVEKQERHSAVSRAKTHSFMTSFPSVCTGLKGWAFLSIWWVEWPLRHTHTHPPLLCTALLLSWKPLASIGMASINWVFATQTPENKVKETVVTCRI